MFNVGQETADIWANNFNASLVTFFEELESTQDHSKRLISKEPSSTSEQIVVCEIQTKGKGRGQNTWSSSNIYESLQCSIIYKLNQPPQPIATPLFGWSVFKSLCDAFGDSHFSIKAPNDIYINEKKVSGLLLDSVSQGSNVHLIFGVGLNVFSSPNTINHSTSLQDEGIEVNKKNWSDFILSLKTNLAIAAKQSTAHSLASDKINDLTFALQAYFDNSIETINPNGDIVLTDSTKISWRDL